MAKLDPEDFPVETTQAPTRRLALVIGIDAYQPENGCPPLKTAVNDARVLANTLSSKYDYKVTTLLDEQANLAGISATLNKDQPDSWASQIEAGDQVLFYFAGHGLALKEEGGPAGYFIPQNGVSGQPDTFLAMRAVHDALTSLDSFHCLIILDCCYSGAFRWTSTRNIVRPPESTLYRETYERYSNSPAWQVLTSAAYDEKALDSVAGTGFGNREAEDTNHSPFAQALLTALQDDDTAGAKADANDDGVLIATELYLYLRDNVQITAKQTINHNQTPGIWPLAKHEKGEYIFLLGDPNDLPPAPVPDEALNPYRGLESYDEQDADLFFGRTALTQQLAKTVTQQPLTLVLGVSGTGKSSLVKAGLLPYLRRQGLDVEIEDTSPKSKTRDEQDRTSQDPTCDWYFPLLPAEKDKPAQPIRPGEHPLHELRRWLATFLSQPPTEATMRGNASSLASALSAWQPEHPQQKLLLVIDQFEELITLCQDKSERKQFIRLLLAAVEYHAEQFRIVITLRSDFEPQITALLEVLVDRYETITINTESDETGDSSNDTPASKATKRSIVARFFVPLMSPAELREVIQGPAAKAVLFFEPPSLVDTIINEVGRTPGALPLLSFTLSQLYLRYLTRYQRGETEARDLSEDDYQALGGVIGSLSKRADEEYNALDKAHKATMRRIMVRMISTEGGELTRRWVPRSELVYLSDKENERVARVLNRLTNPNVRLLVPGTFKRADGVDELYIEPAHDELVRAWNKLQTWARQSPADLPLRRELNQQANKWSAEADDNKKQNLLWPNDPRLPRLEQLVTGQAPPANQNFFIRLWRTITALWENAELNLIDNHWLNKIELDFVQTSVLRRQQDARQLVRTTLGVIAVLLGLTIFAFGQRNAAIENEERAIAERDIALSGQLAAQSARELDQPNYELALLLAIEAAYIKETLEANTVLHQALAHRGRTLAILTGHTDTVWGATWNGDESRILTWSDDGTARLWDGQDGHEVATLAGHTDSIRGATWNGDESRILTWSDDGTARLWDGQDGHEVATLAGHTRWIEEAIWNSDESRILTRSGDDTARLWDGQDGYEIAILAGHTDSIRGAIWNEDSSRILTWSWDNTARLWDDHDGHEVATLIGHLDTIQGANWNKNGSRILTWSEDGTARLWDGQDGRELIILSGHTAVVSEAAWNSDESRILTRSGDHTIRLWNSHDGHEIIVLTGHTRWIEGVIWNRDESDILTWGLDDTARLWDGQNGREIATLAGHTAAIWEAIWNPDGTRILTWSDDGTARLWDGQDGREVATLAGHTDSIEGATWSEDGSRILTWGKDNTVRLWGEQDGSEVAILARHTNIVSGATWNEDGSRILTWSEDNTVRLWDKDGHQLTVLVGWGAVWSRDESRILTWSDHNSYIWDGQNGDKIATLVSHDSVRGAIWNEDSTRILTWSDDGTARLWDSQDGREVAILAGHTDSIRGAIWNEDSSRILTWSWDNTARLWNGHDGRETNILVGHTDIIGGATWNRDESRILTWSNDNTARLWNGHDGHTLITLVGHIGPVNGAVWNRDENRILSWSDDNTTRVWDSQSGHQLVTLSGRHTSSVDGAAWNRDESHILTWSQDYTARLWDSQSSRELLTFAGHTDWVTGAVWNRDESRILTWSDDGTARLYDVQLGNLLKVACQEAPRAMTIAEWQRFFGDKPYQPACNTILVVEE